MVDKGNITGNLYDKYNSKNPLVKYAMARFLDDFDSLMGNIKAKRVLEIGCGEGKITSFVKSKGYSLYSFDVDLPMVSEAMKKNPHSKFFVGDVYNLPFRKKFDLAICLEVLEHLKDPARAVKQIKKISDYQIFSVPKEPFWRIANLMRGAYIKYLGNTPGHINNWSKKAFVNFLSKDLDVIKVKDSFIWTIVLCKNGR